VITLNHLNLIVTNVAESVQFFERYFNFKCITIKGDNIIAVLHGPDGFELVLMSPKNKIEEVIYPGSFHIGFKLENEEQVNEIYQKLKSDGIAIEHEPKRIRDSFGFYFHFESIMIEIGTV
jgi:catechol 2,3-dioxygenase-like lactoylglutathione lyase family enzyme